MVPVRGVRLGPAGMRAPKQYKFCFVFIMLLFHFLFTHKFRVSKYFSVLLGAIFFFVIQAISLVLCVVYLP